MKRLRTTFFLEPLYILILNARRYDTVGKDGTYSHNVSASKRVRYSPIRCVVAMISSEQKVLFPSLLSCYDLETTTIPCVSKYPVFPEIGNATNQARRCGGTQGCSYYGECPRPNRSCMRRRNVLLLQYYSLSCLLFPCNSDEFLA